MKCKKMSTSLDNKSTNNAIDVTNIINEPDTVLIVSIKNDNKETHILKAKISELQNSSLVVKTEKKSYLYISEKKDDFVLIREDLKEFIYKKGVIK